VILLKPLPRRIVFLALLACAPAALAAAQSWPTRPVKMVVPEAAGGAADIVARVACERLAQMLGQTVLVENRAGDGTIGAQAVARAAADGYTYLFAPASVLVANQYLMKLVPYSAEDDFAGVAMVGMRPLALVANPDLNVKTLAELIKLAKAEPDKLAFASPGRRTLPGLLGEMLKIRAGISMLHVPYKGAQSVPDTIAGRTHITVQDIPAIAGAVQRGELRALAVSSAKRLPELPGVATFSETLPGMEAMGWFAVVAPSRTPPEPIRRMNLELNSLLLDSDVSQKLRALGVYTEGSGTPDQVDAFFRSERERWSQIARELRIEPE
jgi:tripartite-type tricarboxylate transporter receptor subunit TctC